MELKRKEVKTFKNVLTCRFVGCTGEYEATRVEVAQIPAIAPETEPKTVTLFIHVCSACGDEQNFEKRFPYLEYEEI